MTDNDLEGGSILPEAISACQGEQLTLTCSTNRSSLSILRWIITERDGNTIYMKNVPISGIYSGQLLPYSSNVTLYFSRTSEANMYPSHWSIPQCTWCQVSLIHYVADNNDLIILQLPKINSNVIITRSTGLLCIYNNETYHVLHYWWYHFHYVTDWAFP